MASGSEPVSAENLMVALSKLMEDSGRMSLLYSGSQESIATVPEIQDCSAIVVNVGETGSYSTSASVVLFPGAMDKDVRYWNEAFFTVSVSGTLVSVRKSGGSNIMPVIMSVYGLKTARGGGSSS